jgi:hypothetical protein
MNLTKHVLTVACILLLFGAKSFAQNDGMQLGSNLNSLRQQTQGGFYDYSDPQAVNIKVAIWGWVKFPGKYIVPAYSSVNDLLSYAGGPTDAAHLEKLRLMRMNEDSSKTIMDINYSDLMMDLESKNLVKTPDLKPDDVLLVSGEPRYYFKDYLSIILSGVSIIVSTALVIYYLKK